MGTAPIVCRAWCKDGDCHPDESNFLDQRCETKHVEISRSLHPMWEPGNDGAGPWTPPTLEVFARSGLACPPQVVIYECSDDVEWKLTPAEARELANHLVNLARLADGDCDDPERPR